MHPGQSKAEIFARRRAASAETVIAESILHISRLRVELSEPCNSRISRGCSKAGKLAKPLLLCC